MILDPHPQLQWFHVQIRDVTLISSQNLAVLLTTSAPMRSSMVMEAALLVTTSLISCPLILSLQVLWLLIPLLPSSSGKLSRPQYALQEYDM